MLTFTEKSVSYLFLASLAIHVVTPLQDYKYAWIIIVLLSDIAGA